MHPDYSVDYEQLGLECCTKDLLISNAFLLQVGIGSGFLLGLSFPGRQRAGRTRVLSKGFIMRNGFLLQVGVGSGLLRGLLFPGCQ